MEYDKYGNKVAEVASTGLAILTVLVVLSSILLNYFGIEVLTIVLMEFFFVLVVSMFASALR